MSSSHGNLCRDLIGGSLQIKSKTVIDSEKNLSVNDARVKGDLRVDNDTIFKGDLNVEQTIVNNCIKPPFDPLVGTLSCPPPNERVKCFDVNITQLGEKTVKIKWYDNDEQTADIFVYPPGAIVSEHPDFNQGYVATTYDAPNFIYSSGGLNTTQLQILNPADASVVGTVDLVPPDYFGLDAYILRQTVDPCTGRIYATMFIDTANFTGLAIIDPSTGSWVSMHPEFPGYRVPYFPESWFNGIAFSPDGRLYIATGGNGAPYGTLFELDKNSGQTKDITVLAGFPSSAPSISDIAFDPTDGVLYACTTLSSGTAPGSIITIDPVTGAWEVVGVPFTDLGPEGPYGIAALSFSPDGTLYGLRGTKPSPDGTGLYRISKIDASPTPLGPADAGTSGISVMPVSQLATTDIKTNPKSLTVNFNQIGTWKIKVVQRSFNSITPSFESLNSIRTVGRVTVGDLNFFAAPSTITSFYDVLPTPSLTAPAEFTIPPGACSTVTNDLTGKIGIIDWDQCGPSSSSARVLRVQSAGAVGVLIIDDANSFWNYSGSPNQTIPVFLVSNSDGQQIKAYLALNPGADMTFTVVEPTVSPLDFKLCLDEVVIKGCGLRVEGELEVGEELAVGKSAVIEGDLTVNGTINGLIPGNSMESNKLIAELNKQNPEYVVENDVNINELIVQLLERQFLGSSGGSEFPMDSIPIGPLIEGVTVDTGDGLFIKNARGDGVEDGPWRFVNDIPGDDNGIKVLKCGIDTAYCLDAWCLENGLPPNNLTRSIAEITLDTGTYPDKNASFTVNCGWSTEPNYDYIEVRLNGVLVFAGSDHTYDPQFPYLRGSVPILIGPGDVCTVEYFKDCLAYSGNDTIYFYISNLLLVDPVDPSSLTVCRGDEEIFDLSLIINPDILSVGQSKEVRYTPTELAPGNEPPIPFDFNILAGDVIKFTFSQLVYEEYSIRLCLTKVPFGQNFTRLDQHGQLCANTIGFNNIKAPDSTRIDGWYLTDGSLFGLVYIEDLGDKIVMNTYNLSVAEPYYLSATRRDNFSRNLVWEKVGINRYQPPFTDLGEYIFYPETGEIIMDFTDPSNISSLSSAFSVRKFIPMKGDERMWDYELKLKDPEAVFNNPKEFFDFFVHLYKTTKSAGQHQNRSKDSFPEFNAYDLDMTQFKACFGSATRREFDDLVDRLKTTGIDRYYGVKRLIYWPEKICLVDPLTNGTAADRINVEHISHGFVNGQVIQICNAIDFGATPASDIDGDKTVILVDADNYEFTVSTPPGVVGSPGGGNVVVSGVSSGNQASTKWFVNHNNKEMLGFICDFESGEKEWTRLCPGEIVTMTGSGTRLDNIPLRLYAGGWHTGPRPGKEFVPADQYNNWDFYTLRLPLQLTSNTNVLRGTVNGNPFALTIPTGHYYVNDIFRYINERVSGLFFYFDGVFINGHKLTVIGEKAGNALNGPDHPTNPSTLFTPLGLNLGYLFVNPAGSMSAATDGGIILEEPETDLINGISGEYPTPKYRFHTPLSDNEVATLVANMSNINIGAKHGPISQTMKYTNFSACLCEIISSASTEDHVLFQTFGQPAEAGGFDVFESFDDMNEIWQKIKLDSDLAYNAGTPWRYVSNGLLERINIRPLGTGHPAEMSEWYIPRGYQSRSRGSGRGSSCLGWNNWGSKQLYPDESAITYPSGTYKLSGIPIDIPGNNYLEEPFWLVSRPRPVVAIAATRTTITGASNNDDLPQATINVADTSAFQSAGRLRIQTNDDPLEFQTVIYTGKTATSFTGCTGGTGTLETGAIVKGEVPGTRSDANAGTSGFYVQVLQQGDGMNPEITSIDARLATQESIDGTYFILHDSVGSVAFWFDVDANGTPEPAHGADRSVLIDTVTRFDNGQTIVEHINVAIENDNEFILQNGSGARDYYLDPYETHRYFELIVESASSSSLEKGYDCALQPTFEGEDLGFPTTEGVKVSNGPRPPPREKEYAANRWVGLEGEMIKASPLNGLVTQITLGSDPLTSGAPGSTIIIVTHNSHGYTGGETIVMSGATDIDGIPASVLNTYHVITFVDANTYTIDVESLLGFVVGVGGVSGGGSNVNVNDTLQPDCNGRIVFIETDGTDFLIRVQNAEAAGAIGVVFFPDNGDNIPTYLIEYQFNGGLNDTEIPTVFMTDRDDAVALTGPMPTTASPTFSGHINDTTNGGIVDGQWLFGVTRDDVVDRALAEAGVVGPTPKCGYVSHNDYAFSGRGQTDRWDWVPQLSITGTTFATPQYSSLLAAARVFEFFNANGVKNWIYDDRNAIGGGSSFTAALFNLVGDKRESNYDDSIRFHAFDPNGLVCLSTGTTLDRYRELQGELMSTISDYVRSIDPKRVRDEFVPLGFPENGFFYGSLSSNPGPKTVIWYTNATQISAPQVAYLSTKVQSLDTTEFDGDFGDDTCFIGYGCYYRPFATGGNYPSFMNYYAYGRAGEEEFPNPPIPFSDRYETTSTLCYIEGSDNSSLPSTGGVVKMHGQDFSRAHQPQFIWDMNADIFFQDIGFTTGNDDLRKVHIVDANLGARANISPGTSGFAVSVARQGEARLKETSLVDCTSINGSGLGGKYFTMADDAGAVYVWYNTGASADPAPGGRGIVVNITTADRDDEVAAKTAAAINADSKYSAWAQSVDPCEGSGGKPFVAQRHSDVNYCDVTTLRDTIMDRTFVILSDIAADSTGIKSMHFYTDDGYGNLL